MSNSFVRQMKRELRHYNWEAKAELYRDAQIVEVIRIVGVLLFALAPFIYITLPAVPQNLMGMLISFCLCYLAGSVALAVAVQPLSRRQQLWLAVKGCGFAVLTVSVLIIAVMVLSYMTGWRGSS